MNFLGRTLRKINMAVAALENPDLTALAKVVFCELLLAFHNTRDGRCDPSAQTVGARIGRHEATVRSAIAELEGAELVTTKRRGPLSPTYSFPGLDARDDQAKDRAISLGLSSEDRAISFERPSEIASNDRAISRDKPIKRTNKENHPSLRSGGSQQAKRIPEGWQPLEASREFALERGLVTSEVDDQVFLFRNHWTAKDGKKAKKPDWEAAFQSWIVNAVTWRNDRRAKPQQIDPSAIDWDRHVSRYKSAGAWLAALGPAPDHAGCRAPLGVLHRHGFGRAAGAA